MEAYGVPLSLANGWWQIKGKFEFGNSKVSFIKYNYIHQRLCIPHVKNMHFTRHYKTLGS